MVSTSVIARHKNNNNNNNNNSSRNNSSNNSRCSSSSSSSSSSVFATRKKNLQLQFLRGSSLLLLQFTTRIAANNIAVIDEVGSSKLHKFSSSTSFVEDKSCCISLQETRISSSSSSSSSSNSFCWKQQRSKSRSLRSLRSLGSLRRSRRSRRRIGLPLRVQAFWGRGTEKPTVVEMIPITDEEQFDQLLDSGRPILVEWFCFLPLFVNFVLISELSSRLARRWVVLFFGEPLSDFCGIDVGGWFLVGWWVTRKSRMAAWCRKCIYLKPKLEKLAAEFHPQ
jgi:thiol-disulfide isomerase/thioredoxin